MREVSPGSRANRAPVAPSASRTWNCPVPRTLPFTSPVPREIADRHPNDFSQHTVATGPFRVKIRSASFSNVSILPWLLQGVYVPDVITILGSLYFILGDIDR